MPSRRVAVAFVVLAAVLATWPLVITLPTALLGEPQGELDNHVWMAWFGGRDAPMRNLPAGFPLPLIDPVHLLWWAPARLFGPVVTWNLGIVGDVALAALGAWALAREAGAERGAVIAAVAAVASPFLGGMLEFSISEAWPTGWLALHAAALLRLSRTGEKRAAVAAGAALSAFLLSGWYHVAFGAVAELGLLGWLLLRRPRVVPWALLAAGVAALPLIPLWRTTQARAEIWAPRISGLTRAETYTDWAVNPRFGTDLLNLFTPHLDGAPLARTTYVGLAVLTLALVGLTRPSGRALFALALPLYVLTLGHWLRVGGEPIAGLGPLPAGWLVGTFSAPRAISHWYRAAGPASVFFVGAAAVGAHVLLSRWPRLTLPLAGLVLADALLLSPTPWPRPSFVPDPPPAILKLEGGLVQLPFSEGRGLANVTSHRPYDLWQVFHEQPIAENYEGPDVLLAESPTVAGWQRACSDRAPIARTSRTPEEDLAWLGTQARWVVVHLPLARRGCVAAVTRSLGEPDVEEAEIVAWRLTRAGSPGP